jgi:hypothetical protein
VTRDEATRAAILLGLIFAVCIAAAIVAPCDGSCTVAEEVRRG